MPINRLKNGFNAVNTVALMGTVLSLAVTDARADVSRKIGELCNPPIADLEDSSADSVRDMKYDTDPMCKRRQQEIRNNILLAEKIGPGYKITTRGALQFLNRDGKELGFYHRLYIEDDALYGELGNEKVVVLKGPFPKSK